MTVERIICGTSNIKMSYEWHQDVQLSNRKVFNRRLSASKDVVSLKYIDVFNELSDTILGTLFEVV